MGDALLSEKCPFELTWIFCQKKEEKGLESYSFVLVLNHLEGEK